MATVAMFSPFSPKMATTSNMCEINQMLPQASRPTLYRTDKPSRRSYTSHLEDSSDSDGQREWSTKACGQQPARNLSEYPPVRWVVLIADVEDVDSVKSSTKASTMHMQCYDPSVCVRGSCP